MTVHDHINTQVTCALYATASYADKYVGEVTIIQITNNTAYDFPSIHLKPHSSITSPQVYDFPTDRPWAKSVTSPVFQNGNQVNALLGIGINNFNLPYVGAYCAGCNINIQVSQTDNTHYGIILNQNNFPKSK